MKSTITPRIVRAMVALIAAVLLTGSLLGGSVAQTAPTVGALANVSTPLASPTPMKSGAVPVTISIPNAQVNAAVEELEIVDGVMQDPTGPWIVSWYKETPKLGAHGNTVLAGHKDYWEVGPSIFYSIGDLQPGDLIAVTGDNGKVYTYKVEWVRVYDTATAPIQEIVGPTESRALTLITCGGDFDYDNGVYLSRTVVRAKYVGSATPKQQ